MKNWKTSLFGLIAAVAMLFGEASGQGKHMPAATDLIAAVGIAVTGFAARDGGKE